MTRKTPVSGALCAIAISALTFVPQLSAQTTPAALAASTQKDSTAADDEIIVLSPFSIEAAEDAGSYKANATLAGSRVRTELRDVGSAISVVTSQFLKDTGATGNATLLQYTVNTEVGGVSGNFAGLGDTALLDDTNARLRPNTNTRVRGLSEADNTRDLFLSDITWDSFNVGRVDLQRGPNSILFGMGAPAGIINSQIDGANFRQQGNVELRVDNFGTVRTSAMYNQVILPNQLAVRVAALNDDTKYRQRPAFQHDKRGYIAARFDPKALKSDVVTTSFEVKYEKGAVSANRPRVLPPGDLISLWWTDPKLNAIRQSGGLNAQTVGIDNTTTLAALRAAGDLGAGIRGNNSAYYDRGIGAFGRNYGGIVSVFDSPTSTSGHLMTTDVSKTISQNYYGFPWIIMSGVVPRKDFEAARQSLKNYDFYRDQTLNDTNKGFFDFYNKLLDGPNKKEWENHDAFNAKGSANFYDNRFGVEAAFDHQRVEVGQENLLSEYGQAITIDMNRILPDGSVNPNYGKAATVSDQFSNNLRDSKRDSWRLTAFGEFRAKDVFGDSLLAKILGKHTITGLASGEDYRVETRGWLRAAADYDYGVLIKDSKLADRAVNTLNYLSTSSIAGLSDYRSANITNLRVSQYAKSGDLGILNPIWTNPNVLPTDVWNNPGDTDPKNKYTQSQNMANYNMNNWTPRSTTVTTDQTSRNTLTTNAQLTKTVTTSYAGNWQAYLWDGVIVPSVGIRTDKQKAYALSQGNMPFISTDSTVVDLGSPKYVLPDTPSNIETGHTKTYSVVLHTPKEIRSKIWGNTGISLFFNKSENFQAAAGRIDIEGTPIASPTGKTKDYGIVLETLDDRISFKINHYKTTVRNAALSDFNGSYMTWGAEGWAYDFGRANLLRVAAGGWADFTKGYDPVGIVAAATPASGWTPAQLAQGQAAGDAIVNAYMANAPSAAWYKLWGIDTSKADQGQFIGGNAPSGFTVTGNTESKGWEYELTAQPTKNWNIAVNASKTSAQRTDMAGSMINWVEKRWKVYNTPVNNADGSALMLQIPQADGGPRQAIIGDLRFWNGGYSPGETLRGKYLREFMSGYWLYRIQEGSDVPELRPWHVNIVSNYNFDSGLVKGLNVGGGYRWEDKVIVGYPVLDAATINDSRSFDLNHPYKGPTTDAVDLWIGYTRKLSRKLEWHVQLNARNLFGKDKLIPITVQPDGTLAAGRIPEPTTYTLTNTFSF